MIKKAMFLSFTFFGLSLYTVYTANELEPQDQKKLNPVVLELFTSQGCSSCPPADNLLNQVKLKYPDNLIALSYHVDYWDYIGWKDPFSNSSFTKKQRAYANKFGQRSIYTPEMVVNGKEHFVGSDRSLVYKKIVAYSMVKKESPVELCDVDLLDNTVSFSYTTSKNVDHGRLRVVLVINQRITQVKRGENRNRNLKNSNIVVAEKIVDLKDQGMSSAIKIPDVVTPSDELTLVVLIENENKDIVGAAKRKIDR